MNTIRETNHFSDWLEKLKDKQGKARILARVQSAKFGHFGDCKPVGEGVSEMRIHFGPGYRIYFAQQGAQVYLLILGGGKRDQKSDIERAKTIWRSEKGDEKDDDDTGV